MNFIAMTHKLSRCFLNLGLTWLLIACQNYSLTFNERTLYSPPTLFTDFRLADVQLQTCVDQTIQDNHIVAAADLTQLACTYTGIRSLEGLRLFKNLRKLNLSHNALEDIAELSELKELSYLNLAHNQLIEIKPLFALSKLEEVNLENNANLRCNNTKILSAPVGITVLAPKHCHDA